jgi:hypothetical protein
MKKFFVIILCLLTLSIAVGFTRNEGTLEKVKIIDIVLNFFYGQGTTIVVPLTIIEKDSMPYHQYPFIFSPIIRPVLRIIFPISHGNDITAVENYNDLSLLSMWVHSPGSVKINMGLGGSVLAEMYDCGGFPGIVLWSVFIAGFIVFAERRLFRNNFLLPFKFFIIFSIMYMPRNSLFYFIEPFIYSLMALFFIGTIYYLFLYKKYRTGHK